MVDDAASRVRVREVSLGDYVLGGGEVAVLVIVEAVARLLPGVLGNAESLREESHADGTLEYPVYTKPPSWRGLDVPAVLLSGDHGRIAALAPRRVPQAHLGGPARPRRDGSIRPRWTGATDEPSSLPSAGCPAPDGGFRRRDHSCGTLNRRPARCGGAIRRPTVPLPQGERTAIVPAQPTRERQLIRG